jgi:hypothetical protein
LASGLVEQTGQKALVNAKEKLYEQKQLTNLGE